MPKLEDTNYARLTFFKQRYAPNTRDNPLDYIKGINPGCMPLCQSILQQTLLRMHYVAWIWRNHQQQKPCLLNAEEHAWNLDERECMISWYDCPQVIRHIIKLLEDKEQDAGEGDERVDESEERVE